MKRAGYEALKPEVPISPATPERRETRAQRKAAEPPKVPEPVLAAPAAAPAPKRRMVKKGKGRAVDDDDEPAAPRLPGLAILNKARSIADFYTDNAGKRQHFCCCSFFLTCS